MALCTLILLNYSIVKIQCSKLATEISSVCNNGAVQHIQWNEKYVCKTLNFKETWWENWKIHVMILSPLMSMAMLALMCIIRCCVLFHESFVSNNY